MAQSEARRLRQKIRGLMDGSWTPAQLGAKYAKPPANPDRRLMGQGLEGRTPQKVPVCPERMFGTHPDLKVRAIAEAQASEAHALNDILAHGHVCGHKCGGKACKAQRSGVSVQYQGKVAVKWRQQVGRNVLGGGAF